MRFLEVKEEFKQIKEDTKIPCRATVGSAGYDFYSKQTLHIPPKQVGYFYTDIKVELPQDKVLFIYGRSSMAIKRGLILINQVAVIDSDYFENPSNDGNIIVGLYNLTDGYVKVEKDEKIAQGVISNYFIVDDDTTNATREGGIGSTGR